VNTDEHGNALRLKARLLFAPGVAVIDVPCRLEAGRPVP
jgi:hypothetical protein